MSEQEDGLTERVAEVIWDGEANPITWTEAKESPTLTQRTYAQARGAIAAVRAEGDGLEALLERLTNGATYGTIHYDTRQPDPFRWRWIASFDKPTGGFERVTGSGASIRAAVAAALGEGETE